MHFIYGFYNNNTRAAYREYEVWYLDHMIPSSQVFIRDQQRLWETQKEVGSIIDVFAEEVLLTQVVENPQK